MAILPPVPSDEIVREALPYWTRVVMTVARDYGVQRHAAKLVREVWRLQNVVAWNDPETGDPAILEDDGGKAAPWLSDVQPSDEVMTAFRTWSSVVAESYGVDKNWCSLFGKVSEVTCRTTNQNVYINDGYGIDGYDIDGYNRQGLDRDGNLRPELSEPEPETKSGPPSWRNVRAARKW